MTGRQVRRIVLVAVAVFLFPLAATMAWAQDDVASHMAKGEVQYDTKWMSVSSLFTLYQASQKEIAGLLEKNKASQDHITDLNKQVAQANTDYNKDKKALDTERAKIMASGQAAMNQYNAPAPTKPQDPGNNSPNRNQYQTQAAYDQANNSWNNYRNNYQQSLKDYNTKKAKYDTDHAAAKDAVDAQTAALKDCDQRIADRLKARDDAIKPLKTDQQQTTDAIKAVTAQVNAGQTKLKTMGDALRTAAEEKRLALGIVEYKDTFYGVADLQAMVDKINADIEAARQKVKESAGGTVPENWRHPKQDEADTMIALLAKVKAAVAAATPATAIPASAATPTAAPKASGTPAKTL